MFSALHLGHSIPIVPSAYVAKGYQFILRESNWMSVMLLLVLHISELNLFHADWLIRGIGTPGLLGIYMHGLFMR